MSGILLLMLNIQHCRICALSMPLKAALAADVFIGVVGCMSFILPGAMCMIVGIITYIHHIYIHTGHVNLYVIYHDCSFLNLEIKYHLSCIH